MPKARVVGRCMLYTCISLGVLNIAGDLKLHTLIPPMCSKRILYTQQCFKFTKYHRVKGCLVSFFYVQHITHCIDEANLLH